MSKLKLVLAKIWKRLRDSFRLPEAHHCYPGCEVSHFREEQFERIHRYGGFRAM